MSFISDFVFYTYPSCFSSFLPKAFLPAREKMRFPDLYDEKIEQKYMVSEELQEKIQRVFQCLIPYGHMAGVGFACRAPLPEGFPEKYEFLKKSSCVFSHKDFPDFVFKAASEYPGTCSIINNPLERVSMAAVLRKLIADNNLDLLYVPEKK